MADDTAADSDGLLGRVKTLPDPNPRYEELLRRMETPEWQGAFEVPPTRITCSLIRE